MMNMNFVCKLPIPKDIKEQYPMTKEAAELLRPLFLVRERSICTIGFLTTTNPHRFLGGDLLMGYAISP